MIKYLLLAYIITASLFVSAQEPLPVGFSKVHHFADALLVNSPMRYGREALYSDELAYRIYTRTLATPADGAVFGPDSNGSQLLWRKVTADSANRLFLRAEGRGGFGRGGYMYLTYESDGKKSAVLNIKGNSSVYFDGQWHAGDPYSAGWLYIPVQLKKGRNEFYVRGTFLVADLLFPAKPVFLNNEDGTLPFIVEKQANDKLLGAVVVVNTSLEELKGYSMSSVMSGKQSITLLPAIPAMTSRKVIFELNGSEVPVASKSLCKLSLLKGKKTIDTSGVLIESVDASKHYSKTFISNIDGSLQYYAVTPQENIQAHSGNALFLSVHGAGVEAIGQAKAYKPKDWGTLVAATNRRPRGFNWEDWGRLDALEVLDLATKQFRPDPSGIYLTGHSMGGHGTWFLGATYPDKWAAIAPCSGYPTLKGYGSADGLIPDTSNSPIGRMLLRSGNQSDVIKLATNYKPLGVYILHGDSDRVVSVNYARQMRKVLANFHSDLSYFEYPGGEHWFGDQSVDWKPLFNFFSWHHRVADTSVDRIDFITSNPGISASFRWATIWQQSAPLDYSRIVINRDRKQGSVTGFIANVQRLKLNLADFGSGKVINITLDSLPALQYQTQTDHDSLLLVRHHNAWVIAQQPPATEKGPHRYGTFKEAFNNRMIFVYGTTGNTEENNWSKAKARYDAETWYYRGNGAVDVVADKDFTEATSKHRGVILFGNKNTNSAWGRLLDDCPIQVDRNRITAGSRSWQGDSLAAYFTWPLKGSDFASVSVIAGTGIKGMRAADANQYFAGASGFPDFMVFDLGMLRRGVEGVRFAGFYDNEWKLDEKNVVEK